jgi:spermidine synthase
MIELMLASACFAGEWVDETLYPFWGQSFRVDEKFVEEKTDHQHLIIFQNERFGRVMALDGVIMLTEADEAAYHEMMVHVPMISHENPKNVLIIGGGDGGILREVLRHSSVEKVVLVEIDGSVVEQSKKYLPSISKGAFDDPRLELRIQDGIEYVATTDARFDVIICDSTDPIGPGKVLFTSEFYGYCKKALTQKGIFINHHGVPFLQKEEFVEAQKHRSAHFKDAGCYVTVVPTYVGGFMVLGWATDCLEYRTLSEKKIRERFAQISGEMKYYNPQIHKAAFALPQFIQAQMKN